MGASPRRWEAGRFLRRASASSFARHVAILTSGTAAGYALTALAAPVLSRLFDPAQFGLLALFTSIVSILAEGASARYGLTVVLPAEDDDAANLLSLALLIGLGASVLALLAVAAGGRWMAEVLGNAQLAAYLWWVPAALLASSAAESLSFWATRRKAFPTISVSQVLRSAGAAAVQVAAGLLGAGAGGLVVGRVAGEASAAATLGWRCWRGEGDVLRRAASWPRMRALARAYADFPKFSLPQALVNAFSQSVPVFLLAYFFDTAVVGLYAMGHRLLHLPARFIGQSVRQVFMQRASEAHTHGLPLAPLAGRATLGLAAMAAIPAAIVVAAGPSLFGFVLGSEWIAAGEYARWMVLWLFFAFVNPPASVLAQVLRRQRFLLVFDLAQLVARVAAVVAGGLLHSPLTAVALFSVAGAAFNAYLVAAMLLYSRGHPAPPPDAARTA